MQQQKNSQNQLWLTKLSKLRWPPKARNAVKYYWGIPGEQVSVELAFSSGSQAQTHESQLHTGRHTSSTSLCTPESSLTPTQVYGTFTIPAHAGLVLHTQSHATLFLYFHSIFLFFFLCCLFLQFFPHYLFSTVLMYKTTFCWKVTAVKYWKNAVYTSVVCYSSITSALTLSLGINISILSAGLNI